MLFLDKVCLSLVSYFDFVFINTVSDVPFLSVFVFFRMEDEAIVDRGASYIKNMCDEEVEGTKHTLKYSGILDLLCLSDDCGVLVTVDWVSRSLSLTPVSLFSQPAVLFFYSCIGSNLFLRAGEDYECCRCDILKLYTWRCLLS